MLPVPCLGADEIAVQCAVECLNPLNWVKGKWGKRQVPNKYKNNKRKPRYGGDDDWPADKTPLKNRQRSNKERRERPKNPMDRQKRREDIHDIKHRTGREGADDYPDDDDW